MARLPRKVLPNRPHHVTQRGNRKQQTFFREEDYSFYLKLLKENCDTFGVSILAYCLMPNHVHLVLVPSLESSLRYAVGITHEQYTRRINFREGWSGHLWQGRFFSVAMDDKYLQACLRYVELNPVRAQLCKHPEDYSWSSCRARIAGAVDRICPAYLPNEPTEWRKFLDSPVDDLTLEKLRLHSRTGKPLGIE